MANPQHADQDPDSFDSPSTGQDQSSRPAAKFHGTGGINVAVWKHRTDQGIDRYSIRIDRTYKDGDEFKTTQYLRDGDMLRVQKLLGQADDWIEQDKARHRASASQDQGPRF